MTLILEFPNESAFRTFLDRTNRERKDIYARLEPLSVFHQVIAHPGSAEQIDWLRIATAEESGETYEDFKVTPFPV